jgi:peptide-methionine (S)-S-oxide reductase
MDLFGGKKPGMVSPEKALPGRSTKMPNIDGLRHYVLGNLLTEVPEGYQVAVFGNGCFWGSEKSIWRLPMGIYSTAVGYCAGYTPNPTYEETCSGLTGHTEGVRVVYNPQEISVVDVVRMFWESHDPTQVNGQGNDRGTQYRSGLYFFDEDQKILYEASKVAYEKALKSAGIDRPIATQIASASDYDKYGGLWYFAESYHQQYLAKPGARPYCSAQPQSVSLPDYDEWCPFQDEQRKEFYRPKLPQSFWKQYGPKRGCSVVSESNEPISVNAY